MRIAPFLLLAGKIQLSYGHAARLPAPRSVGTGAGRQGHGHVIF